MAQNAGNGEGGGAGRGRGRRGRGDPVYRRVEDVDQNVLARARWQVVQHEQRVYVVLPSDSSSDSSVASVLTDGSLSSEHGGPVHIVPSRPPGFWSDDETSEVASKPKGKEKAEEMSKEPEPSKKLSKKDGDDDVGPSSSGSWSRLSQYRPRR